MLDKETKDRINTARDILVGKVPDPKSQVEQITIALIYKFMDDMDLEAEELGGARSFFTGEYEKYAWHKLFAPSTGGEQRLLLYSEALLKLSQNPGLPSLFRDIFKNAYLPYRDPETLSSFLKEINKFSYDHSERLGDAFEFLLSVLGSQGDAGQFRTPRHLIDFMVAVADPRKDETILDPACGTAGFLISSYKHILRHNTARGKSTLTPDERRRLAENFRGYDISPDMVRLSLVNLYLHGFAEPRIHEYDTLTSEDRWNEYYDIVLANPPFMSPKGGIRPHKRFRIASNRSEVLFVDYIAEHLSTQGRAAVIVPEGIIFQSGTAYKELRKMLVDGGFLMGVISLPAGVFNPYSGVKTSILWMDKSLAKKTDKLLFVKIENDGYDLGAQRRELKSSDLPEALRAIEAYKQSVQTGAAFDAERWGNVTVVEKARVAENGEYGLSGERYRDSAIHRTEYDLVRLEELFIEIRNGINVAQIDEKGKYKVTRIQTIADGYVNLEKTKYTNDEVAEDRFMQNGDILLSHINSIDHLAKSAIYSFSNEEKVIHGINLIRFRPNIEVILPEYAVQIFKSDQFIERAKSFAQRAVNQASIKTSDLKNLQIPLPPLTVQQELVAEIEGYQRVIEGARQVVESYRPRVEVEESWEWVELGEVCELLSGQHIQSEEYNENGIGVPYLTGPIDFGVQYPIISKWTESPKVIANPGSILITVKGSGVGKVNQLSIEACISRQLMAIVTKKIHTTFLYAILEQSYKYFQEKGSGAAIPGLTRADILSFKVPLPDLATQRRIVSELERERAWVEGCRALVRGYEEKVRRRVGRVWGE